MAADAAFLDLAAGLFLALAALGALAAGWSRAGWAGLALAAPALTVLIAAVFAVRGLIGAASAVGALGGLLGLMCAAAAALAPAPAEPKRAAAPVIAGAIAGVAIFASIIWASADLAGRPGPVLAPAPAGAALWFCALSAVIGLAVWGALGFGERAARALPRGAAAAIPAHPRHHAGLRILIKAFAPMAAGFAMIAAVLAGPSFGLAGGASAAIAIGLFALLFGPAVALRALAPAALGAAVCAGLIGAACAGAVSLWADPNNASAAAILAGLAIAVTITGAASLAILAAMGRVGDLSEGDA